MAAPLISQPCQFDPTLKTSDKCPPKRNAKPLFSDPSLPRGSWSFSATLGECSCNSRKPCKLQSRMSGDGSLLRKAAVQVQQQRDAMRPGAWNCPDFEMLLPFDFKGVSHSVRLLACGISGSSPKKWIKNQLIYLYTVLVGKFFGLLGLQDQQQNHQRQAWSPISWGQPLGHTLNCKHMAAPTIET